MSEYYCIIEFKVNEGGRESLKKTICKDIIQDPLFVDNVILLDVAGLNLPLEGLNFYVEKWSIAKALISSYYLGLLTAEEKDHFALEYDLDKEEAEEEEAEEGKAPQDIFSPNLKQKMSNSKKWSKQKKEKEQKQKEQKQKEDDYDWTFDI